MQFELGKCYAHPSGAQMKIVGLADSTVYGLGFVGESTAGTYQIVGMTEEHAVNWEEINKDKWMTNFNK